MSGRAPARTIEGALERGARVYLRHVQEDDAAEFIALKDASRSLHEAWEPRPEPGKSWYGRDAFERQLVTSNTATTQRHLICRNDDEAIVGMVNLSQIFRGPFENAVMGYWVGAPYARRGYTSEGVVLCLRRAFGALGLHRVEANVMPTNEASLALVRRVGFREEGYSARYLQINGRWADHTRWAMTREDWLERTGPGAGSRGRA